MEAMGYAYRAVGAALAVADGENTSLLSVFNASTSPFRLTVDRALLMSASLTAVTGVGIEVRLRHISAVTESGGTAGSLVPLNPNVPSAEPQIADAVSVYTGATTLTAVRTLAFRAVNNDEIPLTGQERAERELWTPSRPECPIVVPPGFGIDIFQVTSSTAGGWIPELDFRVIRQKG